MVGRHIPIYKLFFHRWYSFIPSKLAEKEKKSIYQTSSSKLLPLKMKDGFWSWRFKRADVETEILAALSETNELWGNPADTEFG